MENTIITVDNPHITRTVPNNQEIFLEYTVTNIGAFDMILSPTQCDCGCTSAATDTQPVKPNESTKVILRYNTTGRPLGLVNKGCTILGNFNNSFRISFDLNIIPA